MKVRLIKFCTKNKPFLVPIECEYHYPFQFELNNGDNEGSARPHWRSSQRLVTISSNC